MENKAVSAEEKKPERKRRHINRISWPVMTVDFQNEFGRASKGVTKPGSFSDKIDER
jgi:hypothetical protein